MKRPVIIGLVVFAVSASPAWANNDPTVPADECSGNEKVVGQPFSPTGNAVDMNPSPIAAPASLFDESDFADFITKPAAVTVATEGAQGRKNPATIANC